MDVLTPVTYLEISELFFQMLTDISEMRTTIKTSITKYENYHSKRGEEIASTNREDIFENISVESAKTPLQPEFKAETFVNEEMSLNTTMTLYTDGKLSDLEGNSQDLTSPISTLNMESALFEQTNEYGTNKLLQLDIIKPNQKVLFVEDGKGDGLKQNSDGICNMVQIFNPSSWLCKRMHILWIKTGQG